MEDQQKRMLDLSGFKDENADAIEQAVGYYRNSGEGMWFLPDHAYANHMRESFEKGLMTGLVYSAVAVGSVLVSAFVVPKIGKLADKLKKKFSKKT